MRFTPASLALAAVLAMSSSISVGKPDAVVIKPLSLTWLAKGTALQKEGRTDDAIKAFETALVVDPNNRDAYMNLATIARSRGLPGQAITLYDRVLTLNESDVAALQAQGSAMVEKGAMEMARENLGKIKAICKTRCAASDELSAVIARGAPVRQFSAKDILPKAEGQSTSRP